jgi:phosphoribosyl-AMP cyclohydrolase
VAEFFKRLEAAQTGHSERLSEVLDALPFNTEGLLPAIAQDVQTGDVLMLAWVNRTAIERTLDEGYACYYSRSRQAQWRKGESSGHLQALESMHFDCDGDTVLFKVRQTGPACHTNRASCFYLQVQGDQVVVMSEAES